MLPDKVLLVDDEQGPRFGVYRFLRSHGFEVDEAEDLAAARAKLRSFQPDVTVLDYRLPDGSALDLLPQACEASSVIVLTAFASIDAAVEAVKLGAEHFFTKPVELEALLVVIRRLIENRRNRRRLIADAHSGVQRLQRDPFDGTGPAIRALREQALAVLRTESPLLIRGETGTGKTVLARWIHAASRRGEEPFVDLNCAGISREFLESELFGHEKGAFTGAVAAKAGLLEVAHRGTVFLDEIGDMDMRVQASLLKVLEERRFRRLGEVRDRTVDVRLIAATHHDLLELVQRQLFRRDLYYRISALELLVPPLRERREDIPLLAASILDRLARDFGMPRPKLGDEAVKLLAAHAWPGNIRELRNVLERAMLRSPPGELAAAAIDLPAAGAAAEPVPTSSGAAAAPRGGTLEEVERDYVEQVLREEEGSVERAAVRLGISKSAVYYKARKHQIALSRIRN